MHRGREEPWVSMYPVTTCIDDLRTGPSSMLLCAVLHRYIKQLISPVTKS